jgi:hypothetical protein
MPLNKGRSKKVVSQNIRELLKAYRASGRIGSSRPQSLRKAQKQAVAIALKKAGRSRRQRQRRRQRRR